jgi:hypothetical protein
MHPPRLSGSTIYIRLPDQEVEAYIEHVDERISAANAAYETAFKSLDSISCFLQSPSLLLFGLILGLCRLRVLGAKTSAFLLSFRERALCQGGESYRLPRTFLSLDPELDGNQKRPHIEALLASKCRAVRLA